MANCHLVRAASAGLSGDAVGGADFWFCWCFDGCWSYVWFSYCMRDVCVDGGRLNYIRGCWGA